MTVLKYTVSSVLVVVGILGLVVSYINPMQFIVPYLPFQIEGTIISVDQALVQSWLTFINVNIPATVAITGSSASVSTSATSSPLYISDVICHQPIYHPPIKHFQNEVRAHDPFRNREA